MDKSPLGNDGYRELPSDTDTTSCFDSDGTYIRSEAQSSDSGAALLHHSKRRGRKGGRGGGGGGGRSVSLNRKLKKARHIIRSHEDFFRSHDSKQWAIARQVCFWTSILSILACIGTACVLIGLMPRSCDPEVEWWQGGVVLDMGPTWIPDTNSAYLNLTDLILNIPGYKSYGIKAIKLRSLYRKHQDNITTSSEVPNNVSDWYRATDDVVDTRLDMDMLPQLTQTLHSHQMQLMIEIPALEQLDNSGMMSLSLIQNVTRAIKTWAELGVDAISLVGLEHFAQDPYLANTAENWKTNFEKYGSSENRKVLAASYLLPQRLFENLVVGDQSDEMIAQHYASVYDSIASFELLDAKISLTAASDGASDGDLVDIIGNIAQWDHAPSQPWVMWSVDTGPGDQVQAQTAVSMMLPGTISIKLDTLDFSNTYTNQLLTRLIDLRHSAVPIFMNGNYKTCHSHCDGAPEKVDNYKLHQSANTSLIMLERNYNRRNRYMVISNLGSDQESLSGVASLYSGGEIVLNTGNLTTQSEFVKFKDIHLSSQQAIVIKFPK